MNEQTIKAIVAELSQTLTGRLMGKVFQLSRASLAIDFRTHDSSYLFISVEPAQPRLYMIVRRVKDLEKQSLPPTPFALLLRKHLSGAALLSLTKDEGERIVRLSFAGRDELGQDYHRTLLAQLTGRTANLFLLDERGLIIDALRQPHGTGQHPGDIYSPPPPAQPGKPASQLPLDQNSFATLSEAADDYYLRLEADKLFASRAATARQRLRKELAQRAKLQSHLLKDLAAHGDAGEHKRIGDLLLANLGTAERHGNKVMLTDYYAEDAPRIEIEVDEKAALQEEAAHRFARYTKAKRASQEIARRLEEIEKELAALQAQQSRLERIIEEHDEAALNDFLGIEKSEKRGPVKTAKPVEEEKHARRYRSSDGYEILVGRAARDNDHLTFRVARPHDLWLHAADYPGSHVIVRNPNRAELPQRTIIEAAQLAAHFSQARRDAKVDVHYTQRKFLSKPKGAAPGLVRMSSFRTLTVEPRESVQRV